MNDTVLLVVIGLVLAGFLLLRARGSLPPAKARELLAAGALVIDVRSPGEFAQGRVKKAINVPLGELEGRIGKLAPSKDTPLLCHCASGGRSGSAVSQLKRLGYTQAYNLGSLGRARSIVES